MSLQGLANRIAARKPKQYDFKRDFVWAEHNRSGKPITLYWSNGKEYVIEPNSRMYVPKQIEFFEAAFSGKIVFFGGGLGGTKSFAGRCLMVEACIEYASRGFYGTKAAIFCENYPALRGRHADKFATFPSWLGRFYKSKNEFKLHDRWGGGVIRLYNLDKPEKYASEEFAAVFIDELTFNKQQTFEEIVARVRWTKQPGDTAQESSITDCVIASASNPGRIGHQWVKDYFVDPQKRRPNTVFIPSLLRDNPFFDDSYKQRLISNLSPKKRKAYVEGSWEVLEGMYFTNLEESIHLVQPFRIPAEWQRYRALDHGYKHPTVCLWGAVDPDGNLYIYDEYSASEMTADANKRAIADRQASGQWHNKYDRYVLTVGDPSLKRTDGGSFGNKTPYEIYNDSTDGIGPFNVIEAMRDRQAGWEALAAAFDYEVDSDASEKEGGVVFKRPPKIFVFNHCQYLWSSLTGLIYDEKKSNEDVVKTKGTYGPGQGDDEAETLRYLWAMVGKTDLQQVQERRDAEFNQSDPFTDNPYAPQRSVWTSF